MTKLYDRAVHRAVFTFDIVTPRSNSAGPIFGGQALVAKFLDTFKEYPPSQSPASFSVDQIVAKMKQGAENLQPTGSATGNPGEREPPE